MHFIIQLSLYVFFAGIVLLILGLFKPWMMLWWEDVQNRRKVISLYGTIALCSLVIYWILNIMF